MACWSAACVQLLRTLQVAAPTQRSLSTLQCDARPPRLPVAAFPDVYSYYRRDFELLQFPDGPAALKQQQQQTQQGGGTGSQFADVI